MKKYGFSLKRMSGITNVKRSITKATGVPTTKAGRKRKRNSIIAKIIGLK